MKMLLHSACEQEKVLTYLFMHVDFVSMLTCLVLHALKNAVLFIRFFFQCLLATCKMFIVAIGKSERHIGD